MNKKTFVFGLVLLLSFSALAKDESSVAPLFELYAAGKINQCPVYQLKFNSIKNIPFQVVIKDEFGSVLYEEYISGKEVIRNYMIDIADIGNTPVSIEVLNSSGEMVKKFNTDAIK